MTVVEKIYSTDVYRSLDRESKVLYLYLRLLTIETTLNARAYRKEVMLNDLGWDTDSLVRATRVLKEKGVLITHRGEDGSAYFVLTDTYQKVYKAEAVIKKIEKELKLLPKELADEILSLFRLEPANKVVPKRKFVEPTVEEIAEFALSKGYMVDAKQIVDYYRECSKQYGTDHWVDGRGTPILSWKNKLTNVWFKNAAMLPKCLDAPEGFEFFHIVHEGAVIAPESWIDGKPFTKNLPHDITLKKEYARQKGS